MSSSDEDDISKTTANFLSKAYASINNKNITSLFPKIDSNDATQSDSSTCSTTIECEIINDSLATKSSTNDAPAEEPLCTVVQLDDDQPPLTPSLTPSKINIEAKIDACLNSCKKSRRSKRTRGKKVRASRDERPPRLFSKSKSVKILKTETSDSSNDGLNPITQVKVWWRLQTVDSFSVRLHEKLDIIFDFYAKKENTLKEKLIFTLNNKVITINDTPFSLDLELSSIIEGGILTKSLENCTVSLPKRTDLGLSLKIQMNDVKKPIILTIQKTDSMGVLLGKLAEEVKKPIESLKLYFDGELINHTNTPDDFDLEGGECLDLKILL